MVHSFKHPDHAHNQCDADRNFGDGNAVGAGILAIFARLDITPLFLCGAIPALGMVGRKIRRIWLLAKQTGDKIISFCPHLRDNQLPETLPCSAEHIEQLLQSK